MNSKNWEKYSLWLTTKYIVPNFTPTAYLFGITEYKDNRINMYSLLIDNNINLIVGEFVGEMVGRSVG